MARKGIGFFDSRGHFFKRPEDATLSDIAGMLGKIGEGEGLAQGIAHLIFDRRAEIERIFADHDAMMAEQGTAADSNVTSLSDKRNGAAL